MSPMIRKPSKWVSWWFALSTPIVLWDAFYIFMRPLSMTGGSLWWIWAPYNIWGYGLVDGLYGLPALDSNNGFVGAQSLMNILEVILNLEYLYLRHTSPHSTRSTPSSKSRPRYHAHAPVVGLIAATMTVSKTSLYFLQEWFCGWCMTEQNDGSAFWLKWVLPNGIWVVAPFFVTIALGSFIANSLARATASEIAFSEHVEESAGKTSAVGVVRGGGDTDEGLWNGSNQQDTATTSSSFPTPTPGAALPLAFRSQSLPVIVIGSNRLAASRVFALLEADADVLVISPLPLKEAHPEIQYRVQQSSIRYTQSIPTDLISWARLFSTKNVGLVCVTDTLIGTTQRRSPDSAGLIYQAATSLHIPINISDHPDLSTFTFPSVHRFQDMDGKPTSLQIAISTNGNGCRLASRIRREIITKLPASVGAAVDNVGKLRQRAKATQTRKREKERGRERERDAEDDLDTPLNTPVPQLDTPSILSGASKQLGEPVLSDEEVQMRRMRWVYQMSEYYPFDKLAGMSVGDMDEALGTWEDKGGELVQHQREGEQGGVVGGDEGIETGKGKGREAESAGNAAKKGKGKIYLIGSGPGHPGLLTMAAHRVLKEATVILSDKLVPSEIIALIPSTTTLYIAKKFPGNNEGAQNELMTQAVSYARSGEVVVRLKQGDPFVYGRGGEEVLYFREEGFECTVIPGVSSALAGPLMMGIPVTQRGVAESMVMCTGVGRAGKAVQLPGYVKSRTLVILMGVARIGQIVDVLTNAKAKGRDGEVFPDWLPIAVVERASSPDQRVLISTLRDVEEAVRVEEERPPGMMLVGWAVGCLEGKGEVGVLDKGDGEGVERGIVQGLLGGKRWKVREGLSEEWKELLGNGES